MLLTKKKKTADNFSIELEKTKDILASLGERKINQF
jgi:phosphopantothenoylcysteine decarboxylase/phosphopantothenate--cysteine ligase